MKNEKLMKLLATIWRRVLARRMMGREREIHSPGSKMRESLSEPGVSPARQNIAVTIKVWLFFKKIEGATGFGEAGNLNAAQIFGRKFQNRRARARQQRHPGGQFQDAVGLDAGFDGLHYNGK
jgi:hypothetical protein